MFNINKKCQWQAQNKASDSSTPCIYGAEVLGANGRSEKPVSDVLKQTVLWYIKQVRLGNSNPRRGKIFGFIFTAVEGLYTWQGEQEESP